MSPQDPAVADSRYWCWPGRIRSLALERLRFLKEERRPASRCHTWTHTHGGSPEVAPEGLLCPCWGFARGGADWAQLLRACKRARTSELAVRLGTSARGVPAGRLLEMCIFLKLPSLPPGYLLHLPCAFGREGVAQVTSKAECIASGVKM